jgi:sodium transport system permease protein
VNASRSPVLALFLTELRTLLRDRRTLVLSIGLPLLLMPILLFGSRWMEERRREGLAEREATYAVAGPRADEARALIDQARHRAAAGAAGTAPAALLLREISVEAPAEALAADALDFYVEAQDAGALAERVASEIEPHPPGEGAQGRSPARTARTGLDLGDPTVTTPPPDLLALSLVFRGDRDRSRTPAERLLAGLRDVRREQRADLLVRAGYPDAREGAAAIEPVNLAGEGQVAGLALGRLLTVLLLFFLMWSGAIIAQDTLAGEKERGTLETLLTTAMSRREIVLGKFLLVLAVALAITLIQVANLLVYVGFGLIPVSQGLTAAITPGLAAGLLVFFLPLAALMSGLLVLVSGYARSYREAQLYFMPLMLVAAVPAMASSLPEVTLRSAIVAVPIANISVGVRDLLVGRVDWLMLPIAWIVTAAAAGYTMFLAERTLSAERLIVPSTGDDAARGSTGAVRPTQVAAWFGVVWALLLIVSLNVGPQFDIRAQLFVNLVIIFLGGSLWFMRRHRLGIRDTLLLWRPHPAAWIAVLAGVPAGLITGVGMFRLSEIFVPVPRELLESFSQYLIPDAVPFWQLLLLMMLLPAICEEVAFRGVMLQTLRRHFSPMTATLLVGIAFGLAHFSLFRIFATAYLGILLAAVTILTGSIFPAMLWHGLNNGLALAAGRFEWRFDTFEPGTYVAAVLVLAACFWILWRTRSET